MVEDVRERACVGGVRVDGFFSIDIVDIGTSTECVWTTSVLSLRRLDALLNALFDGQEGLIGSRRRRHVARHGKEIVWEREGEMDLLDVESLG